MFVNSFRCGFWFQYHNGSPNVLSALMRSMQLCFGICTNNGAAGAADVTHCDVNVQ